MQRRVAGDVQERYRVSERRVSMTFRFNRSSLQYTARRNELNEVLRVKIKELAATRVRYGYRRLSVLLRREGWKVNDKRVHRLYCQEGLSLRAKATKRRRRSAAVRVRIAPTGPNTVWSMDFMHDRLMGDRRQPFRILTIVDIVTRECLALEVASGFRAVTVIDVLSRIVQRRGAPIAIRCDQGTEFTAEALDQWAYTNKIDSTSRGQASPLTTRSSSRSTRAFAKSCSTPGGLLIYKRLVEPRGRGGGSTTKIDRTDHCPTKRRKPSRHRQKSRGASKNHTLRWPSEWGTSNRLVVKILQFESV